MDDAERLVTLGDTADHDAESQNVRKLREPAGFALHLAPDGIDPLAAAGNFGGDTAVGELFGQLLLDLDDPGARSGSQCFEPLAQDLVGLRIEFAKGELLQLLA